MLQQEVTILNGQDAADFPLERLKAFMAQFSVRI
jgi:hypothetical protein